MCGSVISFLFVAITFIDYVVPCAIAADLDNAQGSGIAALFWLAPNTVLVGATVWTFKHQPLDGSTCPEPPAEDPEAYLQRGPQRVLWLPGTGGLMRGARRIVHAVDHAARGALPGSSAGGEGGLHLI